MDKKQANFSHQDSSSQEEATNEETTFEDVTGQEDISSPAEPALSTAETELADLKDQLLRALAETENVRRRAVQEKEDAHKYGMTNLARDIVSIADNIRRALDHLDKDSLPVELKPFIEGVEITEKELHNLFDKYSIKKIDPLGEKFNSNFHQAMFEQESSDHESGTITQVMQAGYTLHDRLLRPAMVGVAKKKNPEG